MGKLNEKTLEIQKEITVVLTAELFCGMIKKNGKIAKKRVLYGEKDNLQSIDTVNGFAEKCGANVTVMENGEHWLHTDEQMMFLDECKKIFLRCCFHKKR